MPDLEDLYREIILDHYRSPRNRGELESPPAHRVEGFNPLCGDEVVVYLDVDDDGNVRELKISGQGCSISQSSASMMSAAVNGKSVAEARDMTRAFKEMMSIHEHEIAGSDGEPESRVPRGQPRRPRRPPGRREVPGAHQVRHPLLEHPHPGPRRDRGRAGLTRDTVPLRPIRHQ